VPTKHFLNLKVIYWQESRQLYLQCRTSMAGCCVFIIMLVVVP
jgi:hypothetical protein